MTRKAQAMAHANIALVKYWGKRDAALNIPAAGSLSLTLEALTTTTEVELGHFERDHLHLDGRDVTGPGLERLTRWLDLVRETLGGDWRARVSSTNDFPTASGLASSASAYAALALAVTRAAGARLDRRELSIMARRGSGSAARSIFGGLVLMHTGRRDDGRDAYAEPLVERLDWPLRMVIAVVGGGVEKAIGSTEAMTHCARTSPLYPGWLSSVAGDIEAARAAISARDLDALGAIVEASALTMHAAALAARPAIIYFQPATLACHAAIRALRERGVPAYSTMDAGPHVKVLTSADQAERVAETASAVAGVTEVIISGPGGPARVVDEDDA